MDNKNKPKKVYKAGLLSLSLWENENETNKNVSFTFQKAYKEENSEEWKYTQNLNLNDLPKLNLLIEEAYRENTLRN
jgi:hypothetical protein